jgi:hypothetical protein
MLTLSSELLIGRGLHRECYVHPDNESLCVKVVIQGDDTETKREQAYYRFLEKRLTDWSAISQFHGKQVTNLGECAVFDLIRNANGEVSIPISKYMEDSSNFDLHAADIAKALKTFRSYQLKHNIQTMSLKPWNLVYQLDDSGKGKICLIDSLGNSDFIPICSYSSFLGRKKIIRKWAKFKALIERHYANRADIMSFTKLLS